MPDERLREAERIWQAGGDPEAYDVACRRAGLPSPPRLEALNHLRAMVYDAFHPAHLLTSCCNKPVWWGHTHVADFVLERPLCCHRCPAYGGHTRQLGTLILDVERPPSPLILRAPEDYLDPFPNSAGWLRQDRPAPIPTKLLAGILQTYSEGRIRMRASDLLDYPLGFTFQGGPVA